MENCSWVNVSFDNQILTNLCFNNTLILDYPCSVSYECKPYSISLSRGSYFIEVYGAEGGSHINQTGKGGGIRGILPLSKEKSFFAFVGAKGESRDKSQNTGITKPSFGGGGSGSFYQYDHLTGGGGGASDIRTKIDSLESRIIVAGGGGGSGVNTRSDTYHFSPGGHGSGGIGQSGQCTNGNCGSGALLFGAGETGIKGTFGFGGNATNSTSFDGCGGGGGYWGGNAGKSYSAAGGGGSGYINRRMFVDYERLTGVREGNGMIRITFIFSKPMIYTNPQSSRNCLTSLVWIIALISS